MLFFEIYVILFRNELLLPQLALAGIQHYIALIIEYPLYVADTDVEELAHPAGDAFEIPDVRHRYRKLDVSQSLPTDLGLRHLDLALVAYHSPVPDSLILATVTLPVLDRAEDSLAEKAIPLRLKGPVVDGLRLGDLTV